MKPILFDTNMVRAILAGTKTVTRRVVRPQPEKSAHSPYKCVGGRFAFRIGERGCTDQHKPPYRLGDILYVRETWLKDVGRYMYKADYSDYEKFYRSGKEVSIKWRPSIHMPSEAARLFLRVTDVRVERLQDISEEQAEREGCCAGRIEITSGPWGLEDDPDEWTAREHFVDVWSNTVKPPDRARYGWAANPWVWVIEFERCGKPEEREGGNNGRGGN